MIAVKKRIEEKDQVSEDFIDRFNIEDENKEIIDDAQKIIINNFDNKELIEEEIILNPKKYILSKTDTRGVIEYGNDYFVEISGYSENELIGQPHSIIRHPDMPKVVFKLLWQRIKSHENIIAVVKNRAKDGRYYWVITDFEIKIDKITNKVTGYFAYRKAAPREAIRNIEPLYAKLIEIEKTSGVDGSLKYLTALLESENKTYDQFIDEVTGRNSLMKIWFKAMKKFFS